MMQVTSWQSALGLFLGGLCFGAGWAIASKVLGKVWS